RKPVTEAGIALAGPLPVPSDTANRELLLRAQRGEMSAFEGLVEQYRDSVFGFALRMTQSETEAADIAEESFHSAHLHLQDFADEAAFCAWAHQIAANCALVRLRQPWAGPKVEDELQSPDFNELGDLPEKVAADWPGAFDGECLDGRLRRAIEEATDRLPRQHRQAFLLKDIVGLSYAQIAEIDGDSIAAVKKRLHQARLSMRETIARFCRQK